MATWGTTTTITSTSNIWYDWVQPTSTTAAATGHVWITWTNATNTTSDTAWVNWQDLEHDQYTAIPTPPLTAEQVAQLNEQRIAAQEREKERQRIAAEANKRAEELLYEHLTDEQRAQLRRDKFFVVVGGKSKKHYRIRGDHYTRNIARLNEKGAVERSFCGHLDYAANAPLYDHLLAQKLMLQHCEEEFLRVANAS